MKYLLFSIFVITNYHLLFSQVTTNPIQPRTEPVNRKFIVTFSGNILSGNNIELDKNTPGLLLIDSIKIDVSLVKFINYDDMFFATTKQGSNGKTILIPRTFKGNINMFSDTRLIQEKDFTGINLSSGQIWGDYSSSTHTYESNYYNKGYEDLKACNYKNLLIDLSDSPESMKLLNKAINYRNRCVFFYIAGITSFIYSINYAFNNKGTNEQNLKIITAVLPFGIGLGTIWIGSSISQKSIKLKDNAIKQY